MRGKSTMLSARGRSLNLATAHPMHTRSTGCGESRKSRNILKILSKMARHGSINTRLSCITNQPAWSTLKSLGFFGRRPVFDQPSTTVSHLSSTIFDHFDQPSTNPFRVTFNCPDGRK